MAAKKLTIGTSPLTNTIYAGSLLKGGTTWAADKQDITVNALVAVIEHCMYHEQKTGGEKVALTSGNTKYIISVEKVIIQEQP
jgi:hypothetical protein